MKYYLCYSFIGDFMKKLINTNNIAKSLIVFLLFVFSAYFAYIPMIIFNIDRPTTGITILLNLFSNVLLCFILFMIYRKEIIKEWKIFSKNKLDCINSGFKYWFIGLLIMVISNYIINSVIGESGKKKKKIVQSWINYMPGVMLLSAGVIAPINEEITFRKAFRNVFKNKWIFAIFSGLIFGLLHVIDSSQYLYILPYGILGFMFALAYDETKTIFTPLCYHMFHNIVLTLISILL